MRTNETITEKHNAIGHLLISKVQLLEAPWDATVKFNNYGCTAVSR
jgi:hypothetical protein